MCASSPEASKPRQTSTVGSTHRTVRPSIAPPARTTAQLDQFTPGLLFPGLLPSDRPPRRAAQHSWLELPATAVAELPEATAPEATHAISQ